MKIIMHNSLYQKIKNDMVKNNKYYSLVINIDGPKFLELRSTNEWDAMDEAAELASVWTFNERDFKSFTQESYGLTKRVKQHD